MIMRREQTDGLKRLAERFGVAPSYWAMGGEQVQSPPETILAALRALGADVETLDDVRGAYDRRMLQDWTTICEPTTTAWDGRAAVEVRLPSRHTTTDLTLTLNLEDGEQRSETVSVRDYKVTGSARPEPRVSYLARNVELPWEIPPGYHRLTLESGDISGSMLIISSPPRAYQLERSRTWGTFLPLYSLTSETSWGAGNFTDLRKLVDWTAGQGGSYVGTLPLLAAFLKDPCLPEPYSPVSRRFWNEFFIDVSAVPELQHSERARELINSPEFQQELQELRADELVDYKRGMQLRRHVLEILVESLVSGETERRALFEEWMSANPDVRDYARFQAICERHGATPANWPEYLRPDEVTPTDFDTGVANYHAYVQWIAEEQIADVARNITAGSGLYLDLPVGVSGEGFDVWSEPEMFAQGFSVGAPPDALGPEGQNWGFPPLHPRALRADGYRHFIEIIQHHMRHASMLRIDHIMGLHRQFWIPTGAESKDGVYVYYPADDLYAILTLESHRNHTELIGEDLGTVPEYVRPLMEEHAIDRMIIVPFEVDEESTTLDAIPELCLTALNTHDLPPFAGVCQQWFTEDRQEVLVTLLKEEGRLEPGSEDDMHAVIAATIEHLGASAARSVLVNLEDLWLETRSQNIPGTTGDENANWRRKASQSFEEFSGSQNVLETLSRLDAARRQQNDEDHQV